MLKDGIETHVGKTNPHVLLIAPHGYPDPDNDENTGALVREMQKILDCPAIINEVYRKPRKISEHPEIYEAPSLEDKILDLNRREHAEMHPSFIKDIEAAIKYEESTFVFWIHGISDVNLKNESELLGEKNSFHCLIGYGQPRQRSCHKASPERILRALETAEIKTAFTRDNAEKYRGHSPTNMNQWFKQSENGFKAVQSIQLEFGFKGLREPKSVDKTAQKLASALLSLNGTLKIVPVEKAPDKSLVAGSLKRLSEFFNGSYHNAMQQAGDIIIERFYGREPERVLEKKPILKESLFSLINKLKEKGDRVPSKSWFYNARDLAAHEQIFKKRGFQIFGNLGHSHKLALLPILDLEQIEALATEATKRGYNVQALKTRIKEEKGTSRHNLDTVPTKAELLKVERKALLHLQEKAEGKIKHHQERLVHFQKCLEKITGALEKVGPLNDKNDKKPECNTAESPRKQPQEYRTKKLSGWGKTEIEKQDGTKVEAIAPIIISASRATDIPAFYSEWLMNRLRRGYLVKRLPYIPTRREHISFEKARLIVFWTKNPQPLFPYLDELDKMGIGYYFQYTLNDYESEGYEPNLPPLHQRIEAFKNLSKRIGPEKVIWRFDPLILSDLITKETLIDRVYGAAKHLAGYTRKLVISFLRANEHRKVVRNLTDKGVKYSDFTAVDVNFVASRLGQISREYGIEAATCADGQDLSFYGISHNKCIDDGLIRRLFNRDERLMDFLGDGRGLKDIGQRKLCGCIVSKDIGDYHTCPHLCLYCYANISEKAVKKNIERIDQKSEMLFPP